MVDALNKEYPINLKHNEGLVNRVAVRYPLLKKSEVGLIIRGAFQSLRDLLVLGKTLNLNSLLCDAKLFFFIQPRNGKRHPSLRINVSTPPSMRKHGQ
jgi:hypothetical protein